MVDQTPRYRSYDPEIEPYDEEPTGQRAAPYRFGQSARTEYPEKSVPLFLSDYDGEPDPSEYVTPVRRGPGSYISSRILAGVSASAAIAILVAVFSSDAARDIIANAKASSTAVLSATSAAVQPNPTQLTAPIDPAESTAPTRLSAPENQTLGLRSITTAAGAPTHENVTRENVKMAHQSALQSDAPQAAAAAELAIPGDAIHRLDPGEIASSLKRGNDLIASGDLAAARLVLRGAANAGDAHAAMTLAGTYDPVVLEKLGVHGFVPDLAMARVWYERAKKFGAAEAPQRLELLASRRQ
jgi:TPR repeat protein